METLPNILARAKGELTALAVTVGQKLAPVIKAIIPWITGFGKSIMKAIDFITDNIKVIKLIASASLLMKILADLLPACGRQVLFVLANFSA